MINCSSIRDHTYRMAFAQRLDVEKREDLLGFEQFEGGDVACRICPDWIAVSGLVIGLQVKCLRGQRASTEPLMILQKIQAAIFAILD